MSSERMTVAAVRYAPETGRMEPHQHAEETVFILDAERAWVRYGPSRDALPHRIALERGMTLHIPAWEWHVFEWDAGGYADSVCIYGQVDNIRPEDVVDKKH